MKPIIPLIPNPDDNIPLFSAPIINGQCVSAVKNLDDPKLLAYYDDLGVMNRDKLNRQIRRSEFVKLVLNAGKVNTDAIDLSVLDGFSDIDKTAWYAPLIAYVIKTGTMNGQEITDENGNIKKIFRPNDTISRAEAAKILSELVRKKDENLPNEAEITSFEDVFPRATLSPYVQYAFNSCLLHGRNTIDGKPIDGKPRIFEPMDRITLAETAKVLYNITHSGVDNAEKAIETFVNHLSDFVKNTDTKAENHENEKPKEIPQASTPLLVPRLSVGGKEFSLQDLIP